MSRKPAAGRGRSGRAEVEDPRDGVVARVIDRTFENPAMTGGLMVMALTATAIVSNAMFLQSGNHPDPLFRTRPTAAREAPRSEAPALAVQTRPDRVIANPPLPRLAPRRALPAEAAAPPAPQAVTAATPPPPVSNLSLIAQVQRELARIGLYSGAIDGMSGARTEMAIRAFETAASLPVTGMPSLELLAALKQPLPPRDVPAAAAPDVGADAQAAELDRRERERAEMIAAQKRQQAESRAQANYRIVQAALNRIGYGPLPVNGIADADTIDAVRRFELDNGMPISGEASDALIARLIAIGAVKPG